MSEPTAEQFDKAFEQAIENMQQLVGGAVTAGDGPAVSPTVMVLMRKAPDLPPPFDMIAVNPSSDDEACVRIAVLSPMTLTPPGWSPMPKSLFWRVMKMVAMASNAYGVVVGMEVWLARPASEAEAEALPKNLEDYDKREEAVVITTEREGERRLYEAAIQRNGEQITLGPWEHHTKSGSTESPLKGLSGNMFQAVPANTRD